MRRVTMLVFLDFEASSLNKRSYPIEVGWIFENGRSESHLIRPAPDWTDWDPAAEAIHHIHRSMLFGEGEAHEMVAERMIEALDGHDILASAPSWDGKWLSALLRAAGYSIEDASGQTGLSVSAVKMNIHRGLARLTAIIEKTHDVE